MQPVEPEESDIDPGSQALHCGAFCVVENRPTAHKVQVVILRQVSGLVVSKSTQRCHLARRRNSRARMRCTQAVQSHLQNVLQLDLIETRGCKVV